MASRDSRGRASRVPTCLPSLLPSALKQKAKKVLTKGAAGERGAGGTCDPCVVHFGTNMHLIKHCV